MSENKKKSIDERIEELQQQQRQAEVNFHQITGAIAVLQQQKEEESAPADDKKKK